jgi:hypothetical protein
MPESISGRLCQVSKVGQIVRHPQQAMISNPDAVHKTTNKKQNVIRNHAPPGWSGGINILLVNQLPHQPKQTGLEWKWRLTFLSSPPSPTCRSLQQGMPENLGEPSPPGTPALILEVDIGGKLCELVFSSMFDTEGTY